MEKLKDYWRKAILENVPHGQEAWLDLPWEDATTLTKILLNHGYAVCMTRGDGDDYSVHWLYAASPSGDLDWPDYGQVVFTNIDYLEEYPQALQEQLEIDYPEDEDDSDEEDQDIPENDDPE